MKLPANFCLGITLIADEVESVQKNKELLKRFQKIIFNRAPTPCQKINSGHSGTGATSTTNKPTNIKFIQKEELYSKEINNQDSKTKIHR